VCGVFLRPIVFSNLVVFSSQNQHQSAMQQAASAKKLSLLDAVMIVSGSMIGSGIFIVSSSMAQQVFSPLWLLAMWGLTGLITLLAALCYGELSGMFPKAGGQYVYLKEAYNPLLGFLYGWSFFAVIQTGTIAAVGVAFSKFTGYFLPVFDMKPENMLFALGDAASPWLKVYPAQLLAIGTIVFLSWLNTRGLKGGKLVQNLFTSTKLIALFGLIICGFLFGAKADVWNANMSMGWTAQSFSMEGSLPVIAGLGLSGLLGGMASAMVGSVFSSDAWNNVTFIAGEIEKPSVNIGRALMIGTLAVTAVYILSNVMYLAVLPIQDIATAPQERVGVSAAQSIFGNVGTYLVAGLIMISTFGCNNGLILSGARVYQTMANDKLFFAKAAVLNKHGVPAWSIWVQCIWASILCLSGRYGDLLDYVVFTVMIFYLLTIAGVMVLRVKRPNAERTYRTPLYPVLPILYLLLGGAFAVGLLVVKPEYTWPGVYIVLAGIPLFYIMKKYGTTGA
jgi:APA family basic amino acid/polyamine antiporter